MRYRKPYKTEIHIHLEKEKGSYKKELGVAVATAIITKLIDWLLG
ncbi:hypothetical protein Javan290_0061 [Streptococcus phage Javan290]|nr:hypothetical protein Javan290_0061 [Streptococcus phage Javan290]